MRKLMVKLLIISVSLLGISFQSSADKCADKDEQLLNLVFPRCKLSIDNQICITVRIKPSSKKEKQLNIYYNKQSQLHLEEWSLPSNVSIRETIFKNSTSTKPVSIATLAEKIIPIKKTIKVNEDIKRKIEDAFRLPVLIQPNPNVSLDRNKYEIWFETSASSYYFAFSDVEENIKIPLLRWAIEIERIANAN